MKEKEETSVRSKNEQIELFLQEKYEFRFNIIKSKPEFRRIESNSLYSPVGKYHLNSFKRELDVIGIKTSSENIRTILESDFSKRIHPIKEYFRGLSQKEPKTGGSIDQLAATVTVRNPEIWKKYLKKWLVAVVANAMNDVGCQNHTCLVLTGNQGTFKTTWLDHLCPQILNNYLFTGKIDTRNKDVLTLIAEYLFINIDDQLKALNKRDENDLKNLITTPSVKYRRPYDVYIEEYPHLGSFMASVNGNDFLTDPTGSRRFLPFEIQKIDIQATKKINMDDVYSEVVWLYLKGFRYWFNETEIDELHKVSQQFYVQTVEYEFLMQAFERPEETDASFMTTAQVLGYLRLHTSLYLSEKRMGEALRKAGFQRVQKRINKSSNPVYGYRIRKIEPTPFPEIH